MINNKFFLNIGKGVLRSVVMTLIFITLLSMTMIFLDVNLVLINVLYLLITIFSILFGVIYATRKNSENGWLVGFVVAFFYMVFLYLGTYLFNGTIVFSAEDTIRIVIALAVGTLSGMLGINI